MRARDRNIKDGVTIKMSDRTYRGRNPVFQPVYNSIGVVVAFKQVARGVPYVRVTPRRHEAKAEE